MLFHNITKHKKLISFVSETELVDTIDWTYLNIAYTFFSFLSIF